MIQIEFIILAIMLNSFLFFLLGYFIATRDKKIYTVKQSDNTSITLKEPLKESVSTGAKITVEDTTARKLSEKDDILSHEGVGIVYRPSSEELIKMNEPQATREAKEAIAEELQREQEPSI